MNSSDRTCEPAHELPAILGRDFVTAYQYQENGGRGPRMFCHESFVSELDSDTKRYIVPVASSGLKEPVYEIVWPALLYIEGNSPDVEANDILNLISPVIALANHFKSGSAHERYEEFLTLLARGALMFFNNQGRIDLAVKHLQPILTEHFLKEIPEWPG